MKLWSPKLWDSSKVIERLNSIVCMLGWERQEIFNFRSKSKGARAHPPPHGLRPCLGIGKMQIQGILAKKTILQFWKEGMNGKMQYLTTKQSKHGDLSQQRPKPVSAGVLRQLGSILLDCVLFLLFLFL